MNVSGVTLGLIEVTIFFVLSTLSRNLFSNLLTLHGVSYYWLCFTVLTGIWEACFVSNYKNTIQYARQLRLDNSHVWGTKYSLVHLLPKQLAYIFYAEYGAYADREYMSVKDGWSRVIESTHAIFCGIFSLLALLRLTYFGSTVGVSVCIAIAMSAQLMNSILYMAEYFVQCSDSHSVNYDSRVFPLGKLMLGRPFMWINLFWTLMPIVILLPMIQG